MNENAIPYAIQIKDGKISALEHDRDRLNERVRDLERMLASEMVRADDAETNNGEWLKEIERLAAENNALAKERDAAVLEGIGMAIQAIGKADHGKNFGDGMDYADDVLCELYTNVKKETKKP